MRDTAFTVLIALLLVASPATTALSAGDVSFEGEVRLSGQPANNATTYTYDLNDLDSASTPTAEFTGSTATEWDNVTSAGVSSGTSVSVPVAGDLDPTGPSTNGEPVVEITGTEQTTSWSASATGASSGSTKSVSVPGNVDPDSETVEFVGNEQTTAKTVSGSNLVDGDTISYDVGGNIPAQDVSVTFTGDSSTTSDSASATGVSPSTSTPVDVGGNLEPTDGSGGNPTLDVSGHSSSVTYNPANEIGSGGNTYAGVSVARDNSFDDPVHNAMLFEPAADGTVNSVDFEVISTGDYSPNVDIYLAPGEIDGNWREGTKLQDNWNPPSSTGQETITFTNPGDVSGGQTYHLEFVTESSDNGGDDDLWEIDATDDTTREAIGWQSTSQSSETTEAAAAYIDVNMDQTPTDVVASTDDGASTSIGSISDGQTVSTTLDLSTSTTSVDFSGSGGNIDYTLSWTERTGTEDPSIDVDGDGSTDASYTGVLSSGETHTASVSDLSTGSHTATVSLAGHQTDVDIDMTERTATEDPGLDLDGDGTTDASYSGILTSGESTSISAETLSNGDTTVETSLTAGTVDYTLSATGRTHTEDPSIDVGGDGSTEASHSGIVSPGTTETLELSSLSNSDSSATVSTTAGTADVAFKFKERQRSVNPAIIINGNRAGHSGTLDDGQTVQVDGSTSWLTDSNSVEVRVGENVGSDAPNPQVELAYTHNATDKINQTYTDEKWSERYDVSKQFNSDQNDVTVELEHSSEIVAVRSLEYRVNGNSWQELTSQAYELDGTVVRADLGDVSAGDQVDVRTAASKVQVANGAITVEEPTEPGQRLDTAIRMDSWGTDSYIRVRSNSDLIRYTYNESWTAPDEYVEIRESGEQRLYMPDATSGSLARVSTIPVEANASTGGVEVSVDDPTRTEPEFVVRPGPGGEGDTVEFTYVNAQSDKDYILWSVSNEIVRDSGTANSPITLTDDDSSETLAFLLDDSGGSGGSTGSTSLTDELQGAATSAVNAGTSLSDVGIILAVGGLIAGAWVLSRQFGGASLSWEYLIIAEGVVGGVLALELISQYSLAGGVAVGIARLAENVGLGLAEAMPLALLVAGGLGYLAIRRWGRPQIVVNREFTVGGSERGEGRK